MALIEHYAMLKAAHVTLVACSGALFALRGAARFAGAGWPLRAGWRVSSVLIDTALLAAGGTLWAVLGLNPLRDTWLGTKLLLLVLYVALGTVALKRAQTAAGRAAATAAALATYAFMVSVALAHRPLGVFAPSP